MVTKTEAGWDVHFSGVNYLGLREHAAHTVKVPKSQLASLYGLPVPEVLHDCGTTVEEAVRDAARSLIGKKIKGKVRVAV